MDRTDISLWRMHAQRLLGPRWPDATSVVEGLLGVQAENHSQASWAVGTRAKAESEASFTEAYDGGRILRTHVLRPTWHFVTPDDIGWLLDVQRERMTRFIERAARDEGISLDALRRSIDAVAEALGDGPLDREGISERLETEGLPSSGRPLAMVLAAAENDAVVCSGPLADGDHTWDLFDRRVPTSRSLDRDEALGELARRYFTGHGPATERDLAYWAQLTLTDARTGIAGADLDSFNLDERTFWFGTQRPDPPAAEPRAHILQVLDETYRGFQDSREMIDGDHLLQPGRERSIGMVLIDARIAGDMTRTVTETEVRFEVGPWRSIDDDERAAIHAAAGRYGEFLAREPMVSWMDRSGPPRRHPEE